MKARVIKTNEIIEVVMMTELIYYCEETGRLYCKDELEFLPNPNPKTCEDKLKNLEIAIKTTDEQLMLFYKWLNEHELQCYKDKDDDSAALFASIKSMFIEIFGHYYKT